VHKVIHICNGLVVLNSEHDFIVGAVTHYFALLAGVYDTWKDKCSKYAGFSTSPKIMKPEIFNLSTRMFWPGNSYRSISNPAGLKTGTESNFHRVRFEAVSGEHFFTLVMFNTFDLIRLSFSI
jgi:hypothetical protein